MTAKNLTDAQLAEAGVGVAHHFGGDAYIKETFLEQAGIALTQHAHDFDHLAYLVSGTVLVQVGDEAHTVTGPKGFLIPAGIEHGVTAITPAIWLCVWGTKCTDPALVDEAVEAGR